MASSAISKVVSPVFAIILLVFPINQPVEYNNSDTNSEANVPKLVNNKIITKRIIIIIFLES
jgi:hypothetical protein